MGELNSTVGVEVGVGVGVASEPELVWGVAVPLGNWLAVNPGRVEDAPVVPKRVVGSAKKVLPLHGLVVDARGLLVDGSDGNPFGPVGAGSDGNVGVVGGEADKPLAVAVVDDTGLVALDAAVGDTPVAAALVAEAIVAAGAVAATCSGGDAVPPPTRLYHGCAARDGPPPPPPPVGPPPPSPAWEYWNRVDRCHRPHPLGSA